MKSPRSLWRARSRAATPVWLALVVQVLPFVGHAGPASAQASDQPAVLPDSVCAILVNAFESLEPDALRAVLAPTDLQIAVRQGRKAGRPEHRSMSVEQALVFLHEALGSTERRALDSLDPAAILATSRTVGCHCPELGDRGDDAFLVLHFGADERRGRERRLYLDLRHDSAGWRVRAVRELM